MITTTTTHTMTCDRCGEEQLYSLGQPELAGWGRLEVKVKNAGGPTPPPPAETAWPAMDLCVACTSSLAAWVSKNFVAMEDGLKASVRAVVDLKTEAAWAFMEMEMEIRSRFAAHADVCKEPLVAPDGRVRGPCCDPLPCKRHQGFEFGAV